MVFASWIAQEDTLAISHHARVFHGAKTKRHGNGHLIGLLIRKRNTKVVFQAIEDGGGYFGRIFRFVRVALRNNDANGKLILACFARIHIFKWTTAKATR